MTWSELELVDTELPPIDESLKLPVQPRGEESVEINFHKVRSGSRLI